MKSILLLTIGAVLLVLAFVANSNITRHEDAYRQADRARAVREYIDRTEDRSIVYALSGIGAVAIIAGIAVMGNKKLRSAR